MEAHIELEAVKRQVNSQLISGSPGNVFPDIRPRNLQNLRHDGDSGEENGRTH